MKDEVFFTGKELVGLMRKIEPTFSLSRLSHIRKKKLVSARGPSGFRRRRLYTLSDGFCVYFLLSLKKAGVPFKASAPLAKKISKAKTLDSLASILVGVLSTSGSYFIYTGNQYTLDLKKDLFVIGVSALFQEYVELVGEEL